MFWGFFVCACALWCEDQCMSKAFTKESDAGDDDDELGALPPIPAGLKRAECMAELLNRIETASTALLTPKT